MKYTVKAMKRVGDAEWHQSEFRCPAEPHGTHVEPVELSMVLNTGSASALEHTQTHTVRPHQDCQELSEVLNSLKFGLCS